MSYQHVTCFFASGTGNSFRAASWLAEDAATRGASSVLVPVEEGKSVSLQPGPNQLVGIYHPAHGLMPPWSMIHFLLFTLPRGRGAHAIAVSTRGGIPLGGIVIPGGSALALFFPLLILTLKGYRVRGGLGIDMPCNMLNIHWGITESNAAKVIRTGQENHRKLKDTVLSGHIYFHPRNLLWECLWCFPFVLYPLLPLVYLLISRVFMAKLLFTDSTCRECGACVRHCPRNAISIKTKKSFSLFWSHRCEACMRCMGFCRHKSIQASHSWAVFIVFVTSWISADNISRLQSQLWMKFFYLPKWTMELISFGMVFIALLLGYRLFCLLQKNRLFKQFFTYSTFTKFYTRRYHEPNTRARDMKQVTRL